MRYTNRWELPGVTFYQVEDHPFSDAPLFTFGAPGAVNSQGKPKTGELFSSLDRALMAWVSEKYTGPRGAGGEGVGTASDWFGRMIGMDQLVAMKYRDGERAVTDILAETQNENGPIYRRSRAVLEKLEARGITLAVKVYP
jgi:hypothetical protein